MTAETAPEKTVFPCPVCKQMSLVEHCADMKCGWFKCRNRRCDAMLDPVRARGHKVDPRNKNLPRVRLERFAGKWRLRDRLG